MLALASDPGLSRFMTGENLLFAKPDFDAPERAEIWKVLASSSDPEVVDLTARLHAFARAGRQPAMSVREVLDASFDPSELGTPVDSTPAIGGLPVTSSVGAADWWTGAAPAQAPNPDSYWRGGTNTDIAASQPAAPGAPGHGAVAATAAVPPTVGHVSGPYTPPALAPARPVPHARGLARITGQPVLAGLISGAIAGLLGSMLAGLLQAVATDPKVDGGLFVGMIAGMLGGMVHSWSALNLSNYGLAARRFLIGAAVGLLAGIVAVFVADFMTRSTLDVGDTENAVLVAYIWALTAALVGLAAGLLRSPKAGAYAFSGGAIAGFVGGLVHGLTSARFEARALQVNGFDGQVLLIASFVAMLIGVLVAVGDPHCSPRIAHRRRGAWSGHRDRLPLQPGQPRWRQQRHLGDQRSGPPRPRAIEMLVGEHHAEVDHEPSCGGRWDPPAATLRPRFRSDHGVRRCVRPSRHQVRFRAWRSFMTPQRIVAGLAALAIGFGVTLVGVALADDDGETIATLEPGVVDGGRTDPLPRTKPGRTRLRPSRRPPLTSSTKATSRSPPRTAKRHHATGVSTPRSTTRRRIWSARRSWSFEQAPVSC